MALVTHGRCIICDMFSTDGNYSFNHGSMKTLQGGSFYPYVCVGKVFMPLPPQPSTYFKGSLLHIIHPSILSLGPNQVV